MGVSNVSCDLSAEPVSAAYPLTDTAHLVIDATLARRLAVAKACLDRLEQQPYSRDDAALASARVEFALASRALADTLITHHIHLTPEK